LPFDLAQGGELVEPFVICYLVFGIFFCFKDPDRLIHTAEAYKMFLGLDTDLKLL